tara:strand:+ start:146 stop:373 length:228 start_codon:yes stop_codon:yes gene_type:complete
LGRLTIGFALIPPINKAKYIQTALIRSKCFALIPPINKAKLILKIGNRNGSFALIPPINKAKYIKTNTTKPVALP